MKIGYFDCFSGASGDMILGALVSAGVPPQLLHEQLARLHLEDYKLDISRIRKQGFAATKITVEMTGKPGHRNLGDVTDIIDASDLADGIKGRARDVFTRLAEAEAKVHGTTLKEVHFHEVGAVDAIIDIVGAAIGIDALGLDRIDCSPIPTGSGTVACDHGTLPIPAPATAELLIGVPLADCDEVGELTTPTGAAILTSVAQRFGSLPAMKIERTGLGAGTREGRSRPNILRLFVGQAADDADPTDEIVLLETNLDDATGEQIGHAFESLFAAGALDVFATPVTMKKNRPGIVLSVLTDRDTQRACEDVLFMETTTFGVRRTVCTRRKLARSVDKVSTRFGEIPVKVGRQGDRVLVVAPEYEPCARAARKHGAALDAVMFEARRAWLASHGPAE